MAHCVNRVSILGNAGREPELRQTHGGMAVCNISIGTDKRWTDKKSGETKSRTSWHKVTAWDKLAELCAKTITTGSKVYVDGELLYEVFEGKDGSKQTRAFIKADQVVIMENGQASGLRRDHGTEADRGSEPQASTARREAPSSQPRWDETQGDDRDLPF